MNVNEFAISMQLGHAVATSSYEYHIKKHEMFLKFLAERIQDVAKEGLYFFKTSRNLKDLGINIQLGDAKIKFDSFKVFLNTWCSRNGIHLEKVEPSGHNESLIYFEFNWGG